MQRLLLDFELLAGFVELKHLNFVFLGLVSRAVGCVQALAHQMHLVVVSFHLRVSVLLPLVALHEHLLQESSRRLPLELVLNYIVSLVEQIVVV